MSSEPFTPIPSINTGSDATVVLPDGSSSLYVRPQGSSNPLPLGHAIQEFVIVGMVGEGGFGIVYLARDTNLGREVALKEYMPAALAARGPDHEVRVQSERHRETFELGRRSFVNEAKLLAAFDQPSLVKVHRYWEQNGTAYMVMPFYEGPTVKQWLVEHGSPPEDWLLGMLAPLMDALEVMHQNRCYHRDIAPDNILLLNQRATQAGAAPVVRPMLLDFGAARQVIGDASQVLTVILKPGYAPIEQYAESASMKQGAWTDVYALCAVVYAAIAARAPQPSVGRVINDELVPAAEVGAGRYSPGFLAVVDRGLSVRPDQRPQDMASLRELFQAAVPPQEPRIPVPAGPAGEPRVVPTPAPALPAPATPPAVGPAPAVANDAPARAKKVPLPTPTPAAPPAGAAAPPPVPVPPQAPQPASRLGKMMAAAGGVLVLVAAGTWWLLDSQRVPPKPLDVAVVPSPPSASAVPPDAPASALPAVPVASAALPASAAASSPPTAVLAPASTSFEVVAALEDMVMQANPLMGVNVLSDRSRLTIGRDRLQFRVKSSAAGHLYVFLSGTDKSHFYLLFPNGLDKDNRILANREVVLPRKSWHITAGGPAGTNHLVAVVSKNPRDLTGTGLAEKAGEISEFPIGRAAQLWSGRQQASGRNPFVGHAVCADDAVPCDEDYGATLLTIDEVGAARGR
jgi:serine/threonine protein kinase